MARELGHAVPLGTMVEIVLSVVGPDVLAEIGRAERLLAGQVGGLGDKGRGAEGVDVRSLLAQFAAELDAAWMAEVADCALEYLATCGRRHRRRRKRTDWNWN